MTRSYIFVALGVFVVVLLAGLLFGAGIANWLGTIQAQAISAGMNPALAGLMLNPLITAMQNPIPGAVVAGVAWPLFAFWLLLLFVAVVYGFGADAARGLDAAVSLFWL